MNESIEPTEQTVPDTAQTVSVNKKPAARMFVLGVGATILVVLSIFLFVVVRAAHAGSRQAYVNRVATALGVSIASVNGEKISYAKYVDEADTLKKFYANNPSAAAQFGNPTDSQISDQVLVRLLSNVLVSQVAAKNNVTVSSTELDDARAELVKPFPSEADANKQLQDSYGWTLDKYVREVIQPLLLQKKLDDWFVSRTDEEARNFQTEEVHAKHILFPVASGSDEAKVKTTAEAILSRIKKGENFDNLGNDLAKKDVAKNLEPGVSGVIMEDLGWFGRGRMVPEFETAVFDAKVNDLIGPIKTNFGYHIIQVLDKRLVNNFEKYMQAELVKSKVIFYGSINNPFKDILNGMSSGTDKGENLTENN
jgi:foldase protein PrsA